jgi:gamma-glutamyl-gamma-aminobutyrate hydrolase PuuD
MIIGLSQRVLNYREREYDCLSRDFYSYFNGHTLLPVPNGYDIDYDELVNRLDVFIITGGDAHPKRTQTELLIAEKMTELGKPIVGICYGAFLLTDTFNGTVEAKYDMPTGIEHDVIYHTYDTIESVNSFHNNVITKEPPGSIVLCSDENGYVESWVKGNVGAIVWHPERMDIPWIPEEIESLLKEQLTYTLH